MTLAIRRWRRLQTSTVLPTKVLQQRAFAAWHLLRATVFATACFSYLGRSNFNQRGQTFVPGPGPGRRTCRPFVSFCLELYTHLRALKKNEGGIKIANVGGGGLKKNHRSQNFQLFIIFSHLRTETQKSWKWKMAKSILEKTEVIYRGAF